MAHYEGGSVANIWKPFSYLVTFSYLEFLCSLLSGYEESKGHTRVNGFLVPYCFLFYPPKGVKEPGGYLDLIEMTIFLVTSGVIP